MSSRRTKYARDPNNTAWTRSTNSFGHKLLRTQGWSPGQALGAASAPHVHLQSDATAAYARAVLRENTVGLGAKQGARSDGEATGLDSFQDLLGRLNGKSEDALKKEQKGRDEVRRIVYGDQRARGPRFVRGGFLDGDGICELVRASKVPNHETTVEEQGHGSVVSMRESERVVSKRNDRGIQHMKIRKPKDKGHRKRKGERQSEVDPLAPGFQDEPVRAETALGSVDGHEPAEQLEDVLASKTHQKEQKARAKAEKAQRKLDRRKRKELRKAKIEDDAPSTLQDSKVVQEEPNDPVASPPTLVPGSLPPIAAVASGRHAVRQRYIRQKKMALSDPRALDEVSTGGKVRSIGADRVSRFSWSRHRLSELDGLCDLGYEGFFAIGDDTGRGQGSVCRFSPHPVLLLLR